MKRSTTLAGVAVLSAPSLAFALTAAADPGMYPTTNTMVAEGVTAYVAAEEARIAAEEAARLAWENDMSGIGPSAYTGEYYDPASEATRQCIVGKESGGNYAIVSSNGMYHGAYQFSQSTGNIAAQKMGRPDLVGVPPQTWNRNEQDMAFWVMWDHGAGRSHWPTAAGC
jgi:hypothetical protein